MQHGGRETTGGQPNKGQEHMAHAPAGQQRPRGGMRAGCKRGPAGAGVSSGMHLLPRCSGRARQAQSGARRRCSSLMGPSARPVSPHALLAPRRAVLWRSAVRDASEAPEESKGHNQVSPSGEEGGGRRALFSACLGMRLSALFFRCSVWTMRSALTALPRLQRGGKMQRAVAACRVCWAPARRRHGSQKPRDCAGSAVAGRSCAAPPTGAPALLPPPPSRGRGPSPPPAEPENRKEGIWKAWLIAAPGPACWASTGAPAASEGPAPGPGGAQKLRRSWSAFPAHASREMLLWRVSPAAAAADPAGWASAGSTGALPRAAVDAEVGTGGSACGAPPLLLPAVPPPLPSSRGPPARAIQWEKEPTGPPARPPASCATRPLAHGGSHGASGVTKAPAPRGLGASRSSQPSPCRKGEGLGGSGGAVAGASGAGARSSLLPRAPAGCCLKSACCLLAAAPRGLSGVRWGAASPPAEVARPRLGDHSGSRPGSAAAAAAAAAVAAQGDDDDARGGGGGGGGDAVPRPARGGCAPGASTRGAASAAAACIDNSRPRSACSGGLRPNAAPRVWACSTSPLPARMAAAASPTCRLPQSDG
jgi:hypothetical protein